MSDRRKSEWPPIISGAHRPAWVLWRGIAITAFMWGLFVFIVEREMAIVWRSLPFTGRRSGTPVDTTLEQFLVQMKPTVAIILSLVATLGVATLVSRRRRNASLLRPQPPCVPDADLARDLGLDEQELNAIREQKIVALDVDDQGKVSVRPDWKSSGARTRAAHLH